MRTTIGLVLVALLAGAAIAQPGEPDPRDVQLITAARATDLLDKAEAALKRHDVATAETCLRRALQIDAPGDVGQRVFFRYVDLLVMKREPAKALAVLESFGENRTVGEVVAEKIEGKKAAIQAAIEAKSLRARAGQARLNALKADLAAERGEARARLMLQGTDPERIEKHLAEMDARHARRLAEVRTELREGRRPRPAVAGHARSALERVLRAHGRTAEEATEEAADRMRAVAEARKLYEEARRSIELIERAAGKGRGEPDRASPGPRGMGMRRIEARIAALDARRADIADLLALAEVEKREKDAARLRTELTELEREVALVRSRPSAGRERGGPGSARRDGLEERVDRIESELRDIRRLLERLLEKK